MNLFLKWDGYQEYLTKENVKNLKIS